MSQKLCPSCQAVFQEDMKFCRRCGCPLEVSGFLPPTETVKAKRRLRRYLVLAASLTLVFLTVLSLGLLGHRIFLKRPSTAEEAVTPKYTPPPSDAGSMPGVNELMASASADMKAGKLNEALVKLDKVIELEPTMAEAHRMRGDVLLGSTRYPEAAESYDRAFTLDSSLVESGLQAGQLHERGGQPQKAIDIYSRLLQVKPNLAEARWQLARLLQRRGRSQEARTHYERLLQDAAYSARARQELEKFEQGGTQEAATPKATIPAADPKPVETVVSAEELISRGMKAYNASDPRGALKEYRAALARAPGNQDVHYLMGLAYEKLGDYEAAFQAYSNCRSGTYSKIASQHVKRLSKKLGKN